MEEVTERVLEVVKAYAEGKGVSAKKVTATAEFRKDLGFDSLDAVELVMALEEEFVLEIPDDIAEKVLFKFLVSLYPSYYCFPL